MAQILPPATIDRLGLIFDDLVAKAEKPAPVLGSDVVAFESAQNDYFSNPLLKIVGNLQDERAKLAAAAGASEENKANADAWYEFKIKELKTNYIQGSQGGYVDKEAMERSQQSIVAHLMNLDFTSAIQAMVMSIPIVGDFMAASGKWLMSKFSEKPMNFTEAQEIVALEKSQKGAFANLGFDLKSEKDAKFVLDFANANYNKIKDLNFKPTERPATRLLDNNIDGFITELENDEKYKSAIKEFRANGSLSINANTEGNDFASDKVLEFLDEISSPTTIPKIGSSRAAGK